jgi:hypothetical protein
MYRNLDGRVIGEPSLDQPEPTKREQAQQDRLDGFAREEFDANAKTAWNWLRDKTADAPDEIRRIVNAAIAHVLLPKSEDASFELAAAVDALRELYVTEREWSWAEFATEGDDEY